MLRNIFITVFLALFSLNASEETLQEEDTLFEESFFKNLPSFSVQSSESTQSPSQQATSPQTPPAQKAPQRSSQQAAPSPAPAPTQIPEAPLKHDEDLSHFQSTTKSYESAFIKMLLCLAGILIFVFVVFFIIRKASSSRLKQSNHFRTIKLLEKRAISPKSMLYLIEIGGKQILLAESQLEIRNVSNLEWLQNEKKGI
jgi:flagellar protein FliO/FliZ